VRLRLIVVGIVALAGAGDASAHSPTTAIGRAVEAFGTLSVSHDPGAAVSDVEAGGFPQIVGSNPKVAFMPAEALTEIVGGPNAVADEVAREAELDGTLVVLAGAELGTWSEDIGDERMTELVRAAEQASTTSPAVKVESLVRSVQAEPVDSDPPWLWIGVALLVAAVGALVAFDRLATRKP
jgi:hypothetical protein